MGWDAHSSADFKTSPELKQVFQEASDWVKNKVGSVDGYLKIGGLDVDTCGYMLQQATGENCWSETPWSPEFVKQMQKEADWDFKVDAKDPDEKIAYWSARKFLEACAKAGLSIRFSF